MWFQDKSVKALGMLADRIRQDLVRRNPYPAMLEALGNRDRWTDSRLVQEDEAHHAYTLTSEFQSAVQKARQARPQAGYAALIAMLIAAVVMLILAGVFIPNVLTLNRMVNENGAAAQLAAIGSAEFNAAQLYGMYVNPVNLEGTLPTATVPISCSNMMLASGQTVQPPAGYKMEFMGGTAATATCAGGVLGYSTYSIILTPNDSLSAQRSFYSDQTQILRYATNGTPGPTSPIYTVALSPVNTSGTGAGTGTSSGASLWYGPWNPTTTYPIGAEVTYVVSGSEPTLFVNGTGTEVVGEPPSGDTLNWFSASVPLANSGSLVAAISVLSGTATNGFAGFNATNSGSPYYLGPAVWCPFFGTFSTCGNIGTVGSYQTTESDTFHTFTVSGASGFTNYNPNGGYVTATVLENGAAIYTCNISNPSNGGSNSCTQTKTVTIPALANLQIQFQGQGGETTTNVAVSWSLSQ